MTNPTLDPKIEERFDEKFVTIAPPFGEIIGNPDYMGREGQEVKDIKSFLAKELEKQKKEIREEIEKLQTDNQPGDILLGATMNSGRREMKEDILNLEVLQK